MNYAPDLTVATIKMVLALAVVLVLLWAAHRWLKRALPATPMGGRHRPIKVIASQPLGMKKSVALVQVPGKVLVLGIGTEQVTLLTHIDDPEAIVGLTAPEMRKGTGSFGEHLQRMTQSLRRPTDKATVAGDQGGIL